MRGAVCEAATRRAARKRARGPQRRVHDEAGHVHDAARVAWEEGGARGIQEKLQTRHVNGEMGDVAQVHDIARG